MKLRYLLSAILLLLIAVPTLGQSNQLSGKISDSQTKEPLPFANVIVPGTNRGAQSDLDGQYVLEIQAGDSVVVVSMLGYSPQTIPIAGRTVIDVSLVEVNSILDEVQVIGYGIQKKSDVTGSVSSVRGADLTKIPSMSPEQALQGKAAGVQVNSVTGAPGGVPIVRIRGIGTLNNAAPIYVVDGVILDDISFLSSSDIESMEILKDASATAIYGSRGANGVVIVTTKRAGIGKVIEPQINITSEYSLQFLPKTIDLLSANQFYKVVEQISPGTIRGNLYNTDWQEELFNQYRPIYSLHVGITGASERNNYYFGIGYFAQEGIINKTDYKRLSLKINDSYTVSKHVKIGVNYTVAPDVKHNEPGGVVAMAYRAWPTSRPYDDNGNFAEVFGSGNPLAAIEYNNSSTNRVRGVGNMYTDISFLKHFTFRSSFGQDYSHVKNRIFTPDFYVSAGQSNVMSDLDVNVVDYFTWLWENTLVYNSDFGKHHVDGLAGYTAQKYNTETLGGTIQDLVGNDPALWYLGAGNITYQNTKNTGEITTLVSSLFRANYNYDSRYLFTASFRRDGSSKFGPNNRYGNFPSFAVGWNIHNESFFPKGKTLNRLKIRSSWGIIGNEKILWSKQFSLVTNNQNAVFNEELNQGATFGVSGNQDIRWEETIQTDAGLEIGLMNDKLQFEFDFYNKITDGILVDLITPGHLGNGPYATVTFNAAKVQNRGFEFNVIFNGDINKAVTYRLSANASTIHNEVLALGTKNDADAFISSGSLGNGQVATRTVVGRSVGAFYGYETIGVFQNESELASSPKINGQQVGDLKYKDQNGDGVINADDRTYIGSYIPKFVGGFAAQFNYRAFDFSIDFSGQYGNKIYNGKKAVRADLYNFEASSEDAWSGEGTSDTEPRPTAGGLNYEPSDYFIEDASYIRLRSIMFGYAFDSKLLNRANITNARVYVRATNLLTLSKYSGYSPEIGATDALASGIDLGVYPLTAIYSIGINLNF